MRLVQCVVVGLGLVVVASGRGVAERIGLDDLAKVVRVSDPQIAPDGKTVAVVVARANLKDDRWDAALVLVDVATKQMRVVTRDRLGVGSPRWSPTGDRLAYVAQDGEKKAQIFVLPLAGGDSLQVTHGKTGASVPAWSPDGTMLAFAAQDEEPEKKDAAKFDDAFEVGNSGYLERARPLPVHVWTVPAGGGAAKRLTSGAWSLPIGFAPSGPASQLNWTKDGREVVFVKKASPLAGDDGEVLEAVEVSTGKLRGLTGAAGAVGAEEEESPVLSPDGRLVAFSSEREGRRTNDDEVMVAPVVGGKAKDVSFALDRNIGWKQWLPNGKELLVSAAEGTSTGYWVQPVEGAARRLALGKINPNGGFAVGNKGEVAFTGAVADHAAELYFMTSVDAAPTKLTNLQTAEDGLELGRTETVTWTSDKFQVDGVVTYPPGFVAGKRYPLVLNIHGGPTATSLDSFSAMSQIFAAQGWVVFEPNYRGSDNEGNAFQDAITKDAGAGPGRDVMAGVEMLKKRGFVDEGKIAVSGWSYGGYMTTWLLGNYPGVWKAAVAGAAVVDLTDQYTLSDGNVQRRWRYGGSPFTEEGAALYRAESPLTYAGKVKAPTLILADVGDWRVTVTNSYKFFHALKDNGVTTQFIAYPVPGHFPADPIRARDVERRWVEWLAKYLND